MALTKEQIAQRIARELKDGYYVNLGIGIPTLVANYIPSNIKVVLQSENGLLGIGPYPSEDEMDVKALIDRWAKAVREGDMARVRADHDSEMLMFDVPPLLSRGLDEYMATWNRFLTGSRWSVCPHP